MKMKMSIQICALLISLTGLTALGAEPPKAPKASIIMNCNLSRVTWDEKANQRVVEDLTPASAKNISVTVNSLDGSEMKGTDVRFSAQTPDGRMDFYTGLFATDMFGKMIQLNGMLGVTIPAKDLGVSSSTLSLPDVKYDDPNTFMNPIRIPGVQFSTGLKSDGTASAIYVADCSLNVSIK